jgi:type I restriction enzyme S subunit
LVLDCCLGDVLERIIDCEHKTAPYSKEATDYLVVRTNNVKNGQLDFEEIKHTDINSYNEWTQRKKPEYGDIIFTREAPAGESCLIPKDLKLCLGQRMVLLIPNKEKVLPKFLSRYLSSRFVRHYIEKYIVGTTVERINIADIPRVRLLVPKLCHQQKIIEVFEYLDSLILTNKSSEKLIANMKSCVLEN